MVKVYVCFLGRKRVLKRELEGRWVFWFFLFLVKSEVYKVVGVCIDGNVVLYCWDVRGVLDEVWSVGVVIWEVLYVSLRNLDVI